MVGLGCWEVVAVEVWRLVICLSWKVGWEIWADGGGGRGDAGFVGEGWLDCEGGV